MAPAVEDVVDVRQLLISTGTFGPREIDQILRAVNQDHSYFRALRDAVQELEGQPNPSPANKVRIGVGCYLIGHFIDAEKFLKHADGSALAQFYLAKTYLARHNFQLSHDLFEAAAKAGYDPTTCKLFRAEALRCLGQSGKAKELLAGLSGPVTESAEYLYQKASALAATGGDSRDVVPLLEQAITVYPNHIGALFSLAIANDRAGNDGAALEMYEKTTSRFPTHVGALLNLGLLYEDRQEYHKAATCYERILAEFPDHPRARLFLKDTEASREMYYDEDERRRHDRINQILTIPISDFELSVRSRNCLQKMGIKSLGDLTRTSEQELLASKNFGETSLTEIKEMLTSRGLRLGQSAETKPITEHEPEPANISPDEQAMLSRPISDLNLSVRARKCMIRLGMNTMGELLRKTGDELLECKNFGVTSLNEVREKLTELGLKLRGD